MGAGQHAEWSPAARRSASHTRFLEHRTSNDRHYVTFCRTINYRRASTEAVGVDLRTPLTMIDQIRPSHQPAALFARAVAASTIARHQSISGWPLSSSSIARLISRHNHARVHVVNRRCAVRKSTPKHEGNCRHALPLVTTYTIAVKTARSSTGAVPPPCRLGVKPGINGSTIAHNSSDTNRRDSASTTVPDCAAYHNAAT